MNAMYRATVLSSTLQNVVCIGCYNLCDQSISVHHVHEQQCSKSAESVCLLVPGSSPIASSPLWWCHIAFHYQSQLSRWFRQALGWIGSTGCSVSHNDCDSYELHPLILSAGVGEMGKLGRGGGEKGRRKGRMKGRRRREGRKVRNVWKQYMVLNAYPLWDSWIIKLEKIYICFGTFCQL